MTSSLTTSPLRSAAAPDKAGGHLRCGSVLRGQPVSRRAGSSSSSSLPLCGAAASRPFSSRRFRALCSSASSGSGDQQRQQHGETPRQQPRRQPKVIISGGSIAGLAAAAALAARGFTDVHVFEERSVLGGAGRSNNLSIWPSGVRALRAISPGLADAVKRDGAEFRRRLLRTAAGEAIQDHATDYRDRFGEPTVMIQWQRLHRLLEERVPRGNVRRRARLARFGRAADGRVDATFEVARPGKEGVWDEERVVGDVLLGCDGVRSVVRRQLLGWDARGEVEPARETGYSVICTTLPTACLPAGTGFPNTSVNSNENGRLGLIMDVGMGVTGVYLGARSDVLETISHIQSKKDRWAALAAPRADGHGGWPIHAALVPLLDESNMREDKIVDRPPLEAERLKGAGPVSLVGDALHLMDVSIGMGAVSALEGGLEVAQCLAAAFSGGGGAEGGGGGSAAEAAEAALRRYEEARLERATAVQRQAFSLSSKWGEHHRRQREAAQGKGEEEKAEEAAKQPQAVGAGAAATGGGAADSSGSRGRRAPSADGGGKDSAPGAATPAPAPAAPASDRPTPAAGKFAESGASAMQISPEFVEWLHSYRSPWTEGEEAAAQQQQEQDVKNEA